MDIQENIKEFSEQEKERLKRSRSAQGPSTLDRPSDVYQRDRDRERAIENKSFPMGSSKIVNMAVASVLDGAGAEGLARAYKRAKADVDALKGQGERGRADIRRQQYMQEYFLPAVEIVINSVSPDELLSNQKALRELDKYVLLEGSGRGYTASYVRQAYGNQLGQVEGRSDDSVRSEVHRINSLLDDGNIRSAIGVANRLKKKIDEGGAEADDIDYELISRVVAYYS